MNERLCVCVVGMGIENWFLFRTGAEQTDSLESLASLLHDSAYRFRSRQMRHDVRAGRYDDIYRVMV